jgi:deazaflavin-dependent oxidoreductase (nitroreductase family)
MSETPTVPPFINRTMKFVLRSPAHAMVSKSVLLISFTGRKSGKTYTTPVSYSQDGDRVTIFTHGNWWKNLRGGKPVSLRLRGRELQGLAETVAEDKPAIAAALAEHLCKVPSDAKYYGVTFEEGGTPRAGEVEKAAQSAVMVRIRLC